MSKIQKANPPSHGYQAHHSRRPMTMRHVHRHRVAFKVTALTFKRLVERDLQHPSVRTVSNKCCHNRHSQSPQPARCGVIHGRRFRRRHFKNSSLPVRTIKDPLPNTKRGSRRLQAGCGQGTNEDVARGGLEGFHERKWYELRQDSAILCGAVREL